MIYDEAQADHHAALEQEAFGEPDEAAGMKAEKLRRGATGVEILRREADHTETVLPSYEDALVQLRAWRELAEAHRAGDRFIDDNNTPSWDEAAKAWEPVGDRLDAAEAALRALGFELEDRWPPTPPGPTSPSEPDDEDDADRSDASREDLEDDMARAAEVVPALLGRIAALEAEVASLRPRPQLSPAARAERAPLPPVELLTALPPEPQPEPIAVRPAKVVRVPAATCPTCKEEPGGRPTCCSDAFHLCRDCTWEEGRPVIPCDRHAAPHPPPEPDDEPAIGDVVVISQAQYSADVAGAVDAAQGGTVVVTGEDGKPRIVLSTH